MLGACLLASAGLLASGAGSIPYLLLNQMKNARNPSRNCHRIDSRTRVVHSHRLFCVLQLDPFIRSIEGVVEKGKRLTVSIQPVGGKAMIFRPTVLVATPNVELRWLGHFLFRGVFDGEHYFQIVPSTLGRVRFVQGEKFRGVLVRLAKTSLDRGTRAGFVAMNQALKARVENCLSP